LWVETTFDTDGDGKLDRMHVSVTRPYQTENKELKLPVIYETSPYYAGVADDIDGIMWDVNHELGTKSPKPRVHPNVMRSVKRPIISDTLIGTWVARPFIVVHSSSPCTGLSQLSPSVGRKCESLYPKAVIQWPSGKDNGYTHPDGVEKINAFWITDND